jgi:hypothetical protein
MAILSQSKIIIVLDAPLLSRYFQSIMSVILSTKVLLKASWTIMDKVVMTTAFCLGVSATGYE